MNNSTVNLTTPETSINSTTQSIGLMDSLEISLYIFNLFFSLPMHSYIIWLILTGTGSGVAPEFFILNLSVCELGISLNGLVFILSLWILILIMLDVFLAGLVFTGRPLFQSLICVERYLAVVRPVTFLKFKPLRYRVICCTVAWIISLGSCLVCMYTIASNNYHAHAWFFSMQLTVIASIQLFCLVAVLRALKQSGPGERGREREKENHMKRRAFYVILITTLTIVIMYVPYSVAGFFTIFTEKLIPALLVPVVVCYMMCGFVHPVLYLHRTGKLSCHCLL